MKREALMSNGFTWEEADELLAELAEHQRDDEVDREYERAMRAQWLEAFDQFNKE